MPDTWTVRIVIIALAILAMESLAAATWLITQDHEGAPILGVTTVCVGAIAALLAATNSKPPAA